MSANKFKVGDVVKCVDNSSLVNLIIGKEYVVVNIHDDMVMIDDDEGGCFYYYSYRFELSNSDVSPQPPKFKEGDMVYLIGFDCLKPHKLISTSGEYLDGWLKVEKGDSFRLFTKNGRSSIDDTTPSIVLATEENRQMLNKLLGVEYEPVKLKGSELAKKLLKDKPQTCYVSDVSDDYASSNNCFDLIAKFENDRFITMSGIRWKFAVPCNQHGKVLEDE